jgi:hypothetical protein
MKPAKKEKSEFAKVQSFSKSFTYWYFFCPSVSIRAFLAYEDK